MHDENTWEGKSVEQGTRYLRLTRGCRSAHDSTAAGYRLFYGSILISPNTHKNGFFPSKLGLLAAVMYLTGVSAGLKSRARAEQQPRPEFAEVSLPARWHIQPFHPIPFSRLKSGGEYVSRKSVRQHVPENLMSGLRPPDLADHVIEVYPDAQFSPGRSGLICIRRRIGNVLTRPVIAS